MKISSIGNGNGDCYMGKGVKNTSVKKAIWLTTRVDYDITCSSHVNDAWSTWWTMNTINKLSHMRHWTACHTVSWSWPSHNEATFISYNTTRFTQHKSFSQTYWKVKSKQTFQFTSYSIYFLEKLWLKHEQITLSSLSVTYVMFIQLGLYAS